MLIGNRTALDLTPQSETSPSEASPSEMSEVDPAAETSENNVLPENLGTEAIEMTPLDHAGDSSGLVARTVSGMSPDHGNASLDTDTATRIISRSGTSETGPSETGTIKRPTTRVAAFETGLRNLVKGEVQRQLGTTTIDKPQATASISGNSALLQKVDSDELDQRIRAAVRKAVEDLPAFSGAGPGAGTATKVRLSVPCDADLRAAISRSMPDLLQDHAIRQQILGVVAVEAVANPGALGELTGIRAFIRAEVRHARGEAMPQAQDNDAAQTGPQAAPSTALEASNAVIS